MEPVYKEFTPDMLERVKGLIALLRWETTPTVGHPDPGAVSDCLNSLSEMVNCMIEILKKNNCPVS
jgi:hypothetical protein